MTFRERAGFLPLESMHIIYRHIGWFLLEAVEIRCQNHILKKYFEPQNHTPHISV